MDAEVLAVFNRLESMAAVRGLEFERGNYLLAIDKGLSADLALKLSVLLDERLDNGQLIGKELMVLGAVEFIMSPLFERDKSADKEKEPGDLAKLFLNNGK